MKYRLKGKTNYYYLTYKNKIQYNEDPLLLAHGGRMDKSTLNQLQAALNKMAPELKFTIEEVNE